MFKKLSGPEGKRYWVTFLRLLRCVSREMTDSKLARFDRGEVRRILRLKLLGTELR